jgi:hypothetical protein
MFACRVCLLNAHAELYHQWRSEKRLLQQQQQTKLKQTPEVPHLITVQLFDWDLKTEAVTEKTSRTLEWTNGSPSGLLLDQTALLSSRLLFIIELLCLSKERRYNIARQRKKKVTEARWVVHGERHHLGQHGELVVRRHGKG